MKIRALLQAAISAAMTLLFVALASPPAWARPVDPPPPLIGREVVVTPPLAAGSSTPVWPTLLIAATTAVVATALTLLAMHVFGARRHSPRRAVTA